MSSESSPVLTVEAHGDVRVVTLNRPEELNTFTDELQQLLVGVWTKLADDSTVGAVVLTGAGRAFTAGGYVPGFKTMIHQHARRRRNIRNAARLVDEMLSFHLPVVAAVNGPAVGLGVSLALMCDAVYMSDTAFLADTHVKAGLVAGDGGAVLWPFSMSMLQAKQFLFTGDRIYGEEAVRLGLANRVIPADELLSEAIAYAQRLADLPRQSLQDTKRALNIHLRLAAQSVLPYALASEEISFSSDDVQELAEKFEDRK